MIKEKKELELDIPLPPVFTKISSDDDIDIGKKLDIGNNILGNINNRIQN